MSTVVLTLVVVVGSFVVAAVAARDGERQPATVLRRSHRAPAAPSPDATATAPEGAVTVDQVDPRPGPWVRLRAVLVLTLIVGAFGVVIALAVVTGVTLVGEVLETAVE